MAFVGTANSLTISELQWVLDDSTISGELSVKDLENSEIEFEVDIDAINLDRYMEPATEEETEDIVLPKEELKGQSVKGTLRIAALTMMGLNFNDAELGLTIRDGRMQLHPLTAGFYGGSYSGNVRLDGSGAKPVLSLDENLDNIAFATMLGDLMDSEALSGTARGHLKLSGSGHSSNEVLSTLNGSVGLQLDEGALEGINVWYEIRKAWALIKSLEPPEPEPARTVFSRMQMDADVLNGVLQTRELIGELPFLTLKGNGQVNLGQSSVDMALVAAVRDMPELAEDPLTAELGGKQLPLKISGNMTDPDVAVDFEALLKSEATQMLLDKLIGGDDEGDEDGTADDGEEEDDPAGDLLRSLLGGDDDEEGSGI